MRRLILDTGIFIALERAGGAGVDVARVHARLLAHALRTGTPRGAHDLIIAATAIATDREVVTHDGKAGFDTLPGVACQLVQ